MKVQKTIAKKKKSAGRSRAASERRQSAPEHEPLRVSFVALGCAKNLVDSEKMLGQLAEAGCVIAGDEGEADVAVVNTCGFLEASRTEADGIIRELVDRKAAGKLKRVVVAGCLVQRDKEAILERIAGIDALVGVNNRDDIVRAVVGSTGGRLTPLGPPLARGEGSTGGRAASGTQDASGTRAGASRQTPLNPPLARGEGSNPRLARGEGRALPVIGGNGKAARQRAIGNGAANGSADVYLADYHPFVQIDSARLRLTPRHYAYLRISEGCDQKCTFCTIPSIRGRMHCKPPEIILAEARELIDDGAVELSLIGQDTTSYGLGEDPIEGGLAGLLRQLDKVRGIGWIRLMYAYPSVMTEGMIEAIADCEHVCKYIDIPLQHINDRVLKAMHRRVNRADTERLLQKLRDRIPGVTIRTTLIAGFPGETEAEFEELVEFVKDFRFDALGVFPYSLEAETPAGRMRDQLPDSVKQARVDALMKTQQAVAFALAQEAGGRRFEVLIDEAVQPGVVAGRHQGQAPMVDGQTFVEQCDALPGQFVQVRCTGANGYDLVGVPTKTALPVLSA